jgi:Membrane bound O-acyl transferase family
MLGFSNPFLSSFSHTPCFLTGHTFIILTAVFQFTLATSGDGGNFVTSLITGYETEPFMSNPMFESQTMAEFWGKRWNKLIQNLLKQGIFKPLRSTCPKWVAMAGTFAVSGIFHEWLMMIIFAPLPQDMANESCGQNQCYKLVYGSALVFFMYMGVLIAGEFIFLPRSQFKKSNPVYKLCMGTIATVGCPFFMAPYVHTTFFKDGFPGYFMLQPIEQ